MLWANAVLVLEKAKPANKLARLAIVLSATLPGLSSSSGKWRTTVCAACRAKPSETGLAFTFHIASKACDKASKLLSRVTVCGKDKVKAGSITKDQVRQIAETKMPDLNANDVEAAMKIIEGTARQMGITVSA